MHVIVVVDVVGGGGAVVVVVVVDLRQVVTPSMFTLALFVIRLGQRCQIGARQHTRH